MKPQAPRAGLPRVFRCAALVLGFALLQSCTPTPPAAAVVAPVLPEAVKLSGEIFGSEWKVTIVAHDSQTLMRARSQTFAIQATLSEVERQLSSWQELSEVSRFNRAAWTKPVAVTPSLAALLATCLDVSQKTNGAFDITLGPLLDLWGLSASTKGKVSAPPSAAAIAAARARTGAGLLHVSSGGLQKDREDVVIDLTAVGDGAAAAAVVASLRERGFRDVLVDVGGEVVASGQGLKGPWQVGVNVPAVDAAPDAVQRVVPLQPLPTGSGLLALSTSGTYREGQHILDPQTGSPVTNDLVSCSVVAADVVVADALSTACVVLGEAKTRGVLSRFPGVEVLFLTLKGEGVLSSTTAGFPSSSSSSSP